MNNRIFILPYLSFMLFVLTGCAVGVNGTTVSTGQTYFSPYAPTTETTAVVYIYWNQRDLERYISFGEREPEFETFVNRKKNARLEEGSYSVVEVEAGRVSISARPRLGFSGTDLSSRNPQISLSAKAGESYYVKAQLERSTQGSLELQFERVINEREAYQYLYGLLYQKNLQESMIY